MLVLGSDRLHNDRGLTNVADQRQRPNMMSRLLQVQILKAVTDAQSADTTEDSELWSPLSIDGSSLHHFSSYTGVPSHSASNARYMATLCMVGCQPLLFLQLMDHVDRL